MAVLYPVAASAEEALTAPRGRAAREREAAVAAGGPVRFVSELTGPAFSSREAALQVYAARTETAAVEDRWCALVEVALEKARRPAKPSMKAGRRWPEPPPHPATAWRLSVSYWRLGAAEPALEQARHVRKASEAAALAPQALRSLAQQPLRPVRPQQPLDIGLFEVRPPDAPHIVMPDE